MDANKKNVYRCSICGNVVELLHSGGGQLVCCGKPMELLEEKTEDEGMEKHVPVVEKTGTGIKVKVGSVPHPMEEAHFIEWVELLSDGFSAKKFLKPGQPPEAEFRFSGKNAKARVYCNLHGLWKSK